MHTYIHTYNIHNIVFAHIPNELYLYVCSGYSDGTLCKEDLLMFALVTVMGPYVKRIFLCLLWLQ